MFHPFHSLLSIKKEGKKQMKSLTKGILASMLAVAPVVAAVGTASANTELVPAARLAIPYYDVSSGRNTLVLLTNVSRFVDLTGAPMTDGGTTLTGEVHIEWYDKSCNRNDIPVELSPGDIDQIDLSDPSAGLPGPGTQGYADIDVRDTATTTGSSVQFNVLLGTVVISDATTDFAIAYPAASGIGSSNLGVGGTIVRRANDGSGAAAAGGWSGTFEAFPARVFVPMYFAEGANPSPSGNTFSSLLAIAALPNGNWAGGTLGEPPGANAVSNDLINPTQLITANTEVFDGCENHQSRPISGHYILDTLTNLFGSIMQTANWNDILPEDCHGTANFPHVDENSGAFIGWIDIPNSKDIGPNSAVGTPQGDAGDQFDRGMVGVLMQFESGNQGDVTRLWGDPAGGGDHLNPASGSRNTVYSKVDFVDHCDIDPSIDTVTEFFTLCFGF